MKKDFEQILDECIKLVLRGESIESVLTKYPDVLDDLEPLLRTALDISHLPKIEPTPEYISTSKMNLLREIRSSETEKTSGFNILSISRRFSSAIDDFWQTFSAPKKWSIAVTAVVVIVLFASLGQFVFFKSSPVMASTCILQILSGEVTVSDMDSESFEPGSDGMVLETGTQVKTDSNSYALLTFNDGSTIKLESETILEITRLETNEEGSPVIILSQLIGRTWSSVVEMTGNDSRFEINTPSATAVVHGTLFTTEVTGEGETTVSTTEGLVSVTANDEEVFVPANQQTKVSKGKKPSKPQNTPEPESEISILITGLTAGSLVDPTGSSTGKLPDGTEFNQIQGSQSLMSGIDTQVITVADPKNGNYKIALRCVADGTVTVSVQGKLKREAVLDFNKILEVEEEQDYILDFNLKVTGESIEIGKFMVKPMMGNNPEKAVKEKEDKGSKDNPPGKNTTENVTDINNNNKEVKPEKTENDNDKGKSANTTSVNQSNKDNKSQKDKQK
ncbi:MAG: FecR domain-containing protein [Dehalococcoidales bacterium]|nr:MAG: FecR domain-containing protein [Dehalococcoidales bacterium]